ncbi:MAG: hypothetical protein EON59_08550 [Alphaproteobacteria bacterium]|nr:MAG: hypothetical protein EON59_08550 [Alphaproteobacteria bacterium]
MIEESGAPASRTGSHASTEPASSLGPPGFDPSRERGGEFAGKPTAALAAQCRMQARENLDPEYSCFMFAVADRLQGFAASKSQGAPSADWQLAYAIEWANRSVESVKERMWAVEDGLKALVGYLAHTPHHNAIEAAAARKLLRSEGWTDAGHLWLDDGAPLPNSRKPTRDRDASLAEDAGTAAEPRSGGSPGLQGIAQVVDNTSHPTPTGPEKAA